jgi:hypothetical protein
MRIYIPEDIVFDDGLQDPQPGDVLEGLGVRIDAGSSDHSADAVTLTGRVSWVRVHGDLVECVIDCGMMKVVAESSVVDGRAPELGAEKTMTGTLYGIRSYLYTDFGVPVPDARQTWLVHSVSKQDNLFVVDADPVFR